MKPNYKNENIFNYLIDVEKLRDELKKQNPKISLEEAILRTFHVTGRFYEDDEIIKLFKLEKYPPNAPPLPSSPKRSPPKKSKSPPKTSSSIADEILSKSKLKKSPPKPPPLPSPPIRSSPKKSKSKLTKEGLVDAKSKLKHSQKNLKPDDPNYDLEMAFRNLEKN